MKTLLIAVLLLTAGMFVHEVYSYTPSLSLSGLVQYQGDEEPEPEPTPEPQM